MYNDKSYQIKDWRNKVFYFGRTLLSTLDQADLDSELLLNTVLL